MKVRLRKQVFAGRAAIPGFAGFGSSSETTATNQSTPEVIRSSGDQFQEPVVGDGVVETHLPEPIPAEIVTLEI